MEENSISFGLKSRASFSFGTGSIGAIYPINNYETLVTTTKEIIRIENFAVKQTNKCQFSTSLFVPDANLIVASTVQKSEIVVFHLSDFNKPLIEKYPTNQLGVFHMIYSKKSSVLLTFGSGVKIWNMSISVPDKRRSTQLPSVEISLRYSFDSTILTYEASILNSPSFDHINELVFLPSLSNGIVGYNIDGKKIETMSLLPATSKTAHTFQEKKNRLLVYDNERNGLLFCLTKGFVHSRYEIGNSTMLWMDFIDSENAIMVNAKGDFYILNLKTGKSFNCYHSENVPTRIFLANKNSNNTLSKNNNNNDKNNENKVKKPIYIYLCFNAKVQAFEIVIPWSLWSVNITKSNIIRRIEKKDEAARVVCFTSNSFVKFFSPKDGKSLTAATPTSPSTPISCFYDRGSIVYYDENNRKRIFDTNSNNEKLFVIVDDGHISVFDTTLNPCLETKNFEMRAVCMTMCFFNNEFVYAIGSQFGEILIVNSDNFGIKKKFIISSSEKFCNVFFDPSKRCLICIMTRETYLFDLQSMSVVSKIKIKGTKISDFHINTIYYAYDNGSISFVTMNKIGNNKDENLATFKLEKLVTDSQKQHSRSVTGIAFSKTFWISVSLDQKIRFWDYFNNNFFNLNLPVELYGCEILNGNRDIVVGTENEIMFIEGNLIFKGETDEIDEEIDNFDQEVDELVKNMLIRVKNKQKEEHEAERKRREERHMKRQELKQQNKKIKKINLSEEALRILHNLNNENNQSRINTDGNEKGIITNENTEEKKRLLKEEEERRKKIALEGMMNFDKNMEMMKQKVIIKKEEPEVVVHEPEKQNLILEEHVIAEPNIEPDKKSAKRKKRAKKQKENKDTSETNSKTEINEDNILLIKKENNENEKCSSNESPLSSRKDSSKETEEENNKIIDNSNLSSNKKNENINKTASSEDQNTSNNNEQVLKAKQSISNKRGNGRNQKHKPKESAVISNEAPFFPTESLSQMKDYNEEQSQNIENDDCLNSKFNENKINDDNNENNEENENGGNNGNSENNENINMSKNEVKKKSDEDQNDIHRSIATSPKYDNEYSSDDQEDEEDVTKSKDNENDSIKAKFSKSKTHKQIEKKLTTTFVSQDLPKQRAPTPPPVARRLLPVKQSTYNRLNMIKRKNSTPVLKHFRRFFEMPPPQVVLDIRAVLEQFGRGKTELLPLIQRINNNENGKSVRRIVVNKDQIHEKTIDHEHDIANLNVIKKQHSSFRSNTLRNSLKLQQQQTNNNNINNNSNNDINDKELINITNIINNDVVNNSPEKVVKENKRTLEKIEVVEEKQPDVNFLNCSNLRVKPPPISNSPRIRPPPISGLKASANAVGISKALIESVRAKKSIFVPSTLATMTNSSKGAGNAMRRSNSNNNRSPDFKKVVKPPQIKPLGQVEESVTVLNSVDKTPRQLCSSINKKNDQKDL